MCDSRGRRERDAKTNTPKRWKCNSATEVQCIMTAKALFESHGLNSIDECSEHGHYKHPLNADHDMPYDELAGHLLPCTTVKADCMQELLISPYLEGL